MSGSAALYNLLTELAQLYSGEGRAGGDATASALRKAAGEMPAEMPELGTPYATELRSVLALNPEPIVRNILTALPYIRWGAADLREGRIRDALAERMPMCELVGPDGMFANDDIRVGLWMQAADVVYGPRRHAAEETFLLLAGSAGWSTKENTPERRDGGATIFHPSNILHTSITTDEPVFAAWRWSGDISFDKYALKG
ncbi:MAG: hypothetical protein GY947_06485 [Rhodobacteraceae bacterium]|nr:hypothetical protein [Paracoccaceae bacterium]